MNYFTRFVSSVRNYSEQAIDTLRVLFAKLTMYTLLLVRNVTGAKMICDSDYTEDDFYNEWEIICASMNDTDNQFARLIDPTIGVPYTIYQLNLPIVYTLRNKQTHEVCYCPVFPKEFDRSTQPCDLYNVIRNRIMKQILDFSHKEQDERRYSNLFGREFQYFLPYYRANNYMMSVDDLIEKELIPDGAYIYSPITYKG